MPTQIPPPLIELVLDHGLTVYEGHGKLNRVEFYIPKDAKIDPDFPRHIPRWREAWGKYVGLSAMLQMVDLEEINRTIEIRQGLSVREIATQAAQYCNALRQSEPFFMEKPHIGQVTVTIRNNWIEGEVLDPDTIVYGTSCVLSPSGFFSRRVEIDKGE